MVLFGSSVGSVQPLNPMPISMAATTSELRVPRFIFPPLLECSGRCSWALEPQAQAAGQRTRPGINVVVDPIDAGSRVNAVIAGNREDVLQGTEDARRTPCQIEGVTQRQVVQPEERGLLYIIIRKVLRCSKVGLQDRGVEVVRRPLVQLPEVAGIGGHVVVDVVPQV